MIEKDCRNTVFIFFYICRMKSKLHFGLLIMLMAFLGRYMQTTVVPNQQIVIQFSHTNISKDDAQNAIEEIQLKLYKIGVEDIKIGQDQNGQLKISYYSNAEIQHIKDVLSSEDSLKLSHNASDENSNNLPENDNLIDYELNISEIQKSNDNTLGFESVEVTEISHKSDRFNNSKTSEF